MQRDEERRSPAEEPITGAYAPGPGEPLEPGGQERLRETAEEARRVAGETTREAKRRAREMGEEVRERASDMTGRIKERARSMWTEQRERAAEEVNAVSTAIRSAAERLREEQHDTAAGYVEALAEQIDGASSYLRERDLSELTDSVRDAVRRHPALFIGGMLACGLLAARFLKASEEREPSISAEERRPYEEARFPGSEAMPPGAPGPGPFPAGPAFEPPTGPRVEVPR